MPSRSPKPSFLPQALAILIPLCLLTIIALRALWIDERQAESRAREEATQLAPILASHAVTTLTFAAREAIEARQAWHTLLLSKLGLTTPDPESQRLCLGLDTSIATQTVQRATGLALDNPAIPEHLTPILIWDPGTHEPINPKRLLDTPPLARWARDLSPQERQQWHLLQTHTSNPSAEPWLRFREFARLNPNPALRINATFESLRLQPDSTPELQSFLELNGPILSETGIPLSIAGSAELLNRWIHNPSSHQPLLHSLLQAIQHHPSSLNPQLLELTSRTFQTKPPAPFPLAPLLAIQSYESRCRDAFNHLDVQTFSKPDQAYPWVRWNNARYLALQIQPRLPSNAPDSDRALLANTRFLALLSPDQINQAIQTAAGWARLPAWAGLRIGIANEAIELNHQGVDIANVDTVFSADSGTPVPTTEGTHLRVQLSLASPELLFADVRRRQLTYGLLVAATATTAAFGLWHARRSFNRQLQLSEMKSSFVSSVSHELRAPIASIRLLAEGLEKKTVSSPTQQQEYLHFIVQECRRLSSLITNVLDYSRIEQGRKEYEFEPVDPIRLVNETVRLMEPAATATNVLIRTELPDDPATLPEPHWDGTAIHQALINLVDNALKHSPPRSTVTIRLSTTKPTHLQLSVHDQGPGIPKTDHERIFEQFYRRGSELRRETRGIGIGLSLVRHTTQAHQGTISVQSEPSHGTTFSLDLPTHPGQT